MNKLPLCVGLCLALAPLAADAAPTSASDLVTIQQNPHAVNCYDRAQLVAAMKARDHQREAITGTAGPGVHMLVLINAKGQWAMLLLPDDRPSRACPLSFGEQWTPAP